MKRVICWYLSRLSYLVILLLVFIVPQFFTGFMWLLTILGAVACCLYIIFFVINAHYKEFENKFNEQQVQSGIGTTIDSEIQLSEMKIMSSH